MGKLEYCQFKICFNIKELYVVAIYYRVFVREAKI
jgi:hypothetical protein